uniref:Uncharacterized protein n=1 Tax=Eutreptiella gymnastica TaxID=73025 RepID=A0A7S1J570_9EUGL|mmetsp:Transcript_68261/g.120796  ORF Transcript_68261/g.120796 Transcript_68261/m.120796 type:complete len:141 (+) Transcript_68261:28-450(+)
MVKKIIKAAVRKAKRQKKIALKKQQRLLERPVGKKIVSTEQADALLNSLCVDSKLKVSPDDEWEDVSDDENMKGDGDLKGVVATSLGAGRKAKQTVKRSTRRRKEKGILQGLANKERFEARQQHSRVRRKSKLALRNEED